MPVHVDHFELDAVPHEFVADLRDAAELQHGEAAERVVAARVLLRQIYLDVQNVLEALDRDAAVHQPGTVFPPEDVQLALVVDGGDVPDQRSMLMSVVTVRKMRVPVQDGFVFVLVRVRLATIPGELVSVQVMRVVGMVVRMP